MIDYFPSARLLLNYKGIDYETHWVGDLPKFQALFLLFCEVIDIPLNSWTIRISDLDSKESKLD